jgi:hypothetical protein
MTTLADLNLSRGAIGFDRINGRQIMIKPCGKPPDTYVGWCHIMITTFSDDGEGTVRRTREAVHESEIVAWLRIPGGVDPDRFEWHPGSWEPQPDTYRANQFRAKDVAEQAKKEERATKKAEREAAKAEREAKRKAADEALIQAAREHFGLRAPAERPAVDLERRPDGVFGIKDEGQENGECRKLSAGNRRITR